MRNAWINEVAAAASAATATAVSKLSQPGPPTVCTAQKPLTAPTSIMPSTPRLSTPERSASSSPSEAKSKGVP